MAGQWDLTPAPVLLAGADGRAHETRPTTTLARDLVEGDAPHGAFAAQPAARPLPSAPGAAPAPGGYPPRRPSGCDERPIRGGGFDFDVRPSTADRPIGGFGSSASSSSRPSTSDRPITGFGGAASPNANFNRRRSSGGNLPPSSSSSPPPSDAGGGPWGAKLPGGSSAAPAPQPPPTQRRASRTSYAPIEQLLGLGFDRESARVALAAAGGDVERAIQIALDDSRAHDAQCLAEWEFEGDRGWVPFDGPAEALIKDTLSNGETVCELRVAGHRYIIDLDALTQSNLVTKRTRRIRRRQA